MYYEDESWETIIVDSEFEFYTAIKMLRERLEDIIEKNRKKVVVKKRKA